MSTGLRFKKRETFVLDAWAFLAFLQKEEPAASRVRRLLLEGVDQKVKLLLSIVNLGEVYYRVGRSQGRGEADETLKAFSRLPIAVLPATDAIVMAFLDCSACVNNRMLKRHFRVKKNLGHRVS
jgi:hypothetical protein